MNKKVFLGFYLLLSLLFTLEAKELAVDLKILNFDDYFAEDTLSNFQIQSGKKVSLETYGSDSEAIAKLLRSNPRYDVLFISDNMVEHFIRLGGILSPIDKSKLPNITNIEESFFSASFDPERKYSMPYFWGTLGIGYRKSAFKKKPDSLKYLFDSAAHSGRIALLADGTLNIQMALKYLGYSLNTRNKEEIEEATKLLKKQKKHIKVFAADNGQDLLKNGVVDIVLEYNGDMLQLMDESDEFGFVVPREGTLLWEDCIVIPARSAHTKTAHRFINYLFDEKVAIELSDYLQYATPNAKAKAKMPKSYRKNGAIFPSKKVLKKCEKIQYNGAKVKAWYDSAWAEIVDAQ